MSNKDWPKGFTINPRSESLPSHILDAYHSIPVTQASDCFGRITGAMGLKAYHNDMNLSMCGMAITVRVRPGDNLMLHKAILMSEPGDIIVVDGAGDLTQAIMGGLMRTTALTRKLGGIVINGAIRDVAEWAEGQLPIYALGHVHRGPTKVGPGEVNVPISCAGLAVMPGDLIIGDADGVLALPRTELAELLPEIHKHAEREDNIRQQNIEHGGDNERFNALLRSMGCPV